MTVAPHSAVPGPIEIEYVTHSSLFIESPGGRLLLDPFFFPELDPILAPSVRNFPPRDLELERFGNLDFVFSSHEHHDHCHPETLDLLRPRVDTVLLPAERPALAARYERAGFRRIRYLENRRPVQLKDGLEVTCYWDDPIDSVLVVKLPGTVILHGNDCRLEKSSYVEIKENGRIDYAFFCSTSAQQLFPFLLPRPCGELERLGSAREDAFFERQLAHITALDPTVVVPYAYTVVYLDPAQLHLNGAGRMTPPLFRDRLRARLPAAQCWPLEPGDVIDATSGTVRRFSAKSLWGNNLEEFVQNVAEHSRSLEGRLPRFDPGDPRDCDVALRNHLERRLALGLPHAPIFSWLGEAISIEVEGNERSFRYLIDVRRKTVRLVPFQADDGLEPGLLIAIPASLAASLLDGAYDAFMVLYTYRISFRLHPKLAGRLSPERESGLYVGVFLSLFFDGTHPLQTELAGLADLLAWMTP